MGSAKFYFCFCSKCAARYVDRTFCGFSCKSSHVLLCAALDNFPDYSGSRFAAVESARLMPAIN